MSPPLPRFPANFRIDGAAVTRTDGIHKDQVGLIQYCVLVVLESKRRWRHEAVKLHLDALRSEATHMQQNCGGPGPTIKSDGEGQLGAGIIQRIRHVEYLRFGAALFVFDGHTPGGGGVLQRLTENRDFVMRDGRFFVRHVRSSGCFSRGWNIGSGRRWFFPARAVAALLCRKQRGGDNYG
jgi:hypothetical protein